MLKIKTIFLLILLIIALIFYKTILDYNRQARAALLRFNLSSPKEERPIQHVGEKIIYDVKLGKVCLGRAEFSKLPPIEIKGRRLDLATFETKLAHFKDQEKIYYDPLSFLPIRVERTIRNGFVVERIVEDYDQKQFTLRLTREKGGSKEQLVIRQIDRIHNAILLPYYIRRIPKLGVGWILHACLPKRLFLIKLVSIEDISVPAGRFRAYRFQSQPKQFQIWVSADEYRIPLKIEGAGVFGYTLVMRKHSSFRE